MRLALFLAAAALTAQTPSLEPAPRKEYILFTPGDLERSGLRDEVPDSRLTRLYCRVEAPDRAVRFARGEKRFTPSKPYERVFEPFQEVPGSYPLTPRAVVLEQWQIAPRSKDKFIAYMTSLHEARKKAGKGYAGWWMISDLGDESNFMVLVQYADPATRAKAAALPEVQAIIARDFPAVELVARRQGPALDFDYCGAPLNEQLPPEPAPAKKTRGKKKN